MRRGIILAGGKGTRLGELTRVTNKHLLPVGKYPMIYYPLSKLFGAGIKDIMLITGAEHMGDFVRLLRSGREYGCRLTYKVQDEAGGIAQALGLAEDFCAGESCVVLLGDNVFEEPLPPVLDPTQCGPAEDAWVILKKVPDPERYGVAMCLDGDIQYIIEKPDKPVSSYAVTGIYRYPPDVFNIIRVLKPSKRGELEITDVNNAYAGNGRLHHDILEGYWTDAGTPESLALANRLVEHTPPRF